jgi:hypothetical protein
MLSILGPQILVCFASQWFMTYPKHASAVSVHTNNYEQISFVVNKLLPRRLIFGCAGTYFTTYLHNSGFKKNCKENSIFIKISKE